MNQDHTLVITRQSHVVQKLQNLLESLYSSNFCPICGISDFAANPSFSKTQHLKSHLNCILRDKIADIGSPPGSSKKRKMKLVFRNGERSWSYSIRRKYAKLQLQTPWANGAPLICRICSFATNKLFELRDHLLSPVHIEQEKIVSGALIWEELSRLESFPEAEEWNVRNLTALSQSNLDSCIAGSASDLRLGLDDVQYPGSNIDTSSTNYSGSIDPRFLFFSVTLPAGIASNSSFIQNDSKASHRTSFACTSCWKLFSKRQDIAEHFSLSVLCRPDWFDQVDRLDRQNDFRSIDDCIKSKIQYSKLGYVEISDGGNGNCPLEIGLGYRRPLFILDLDDDCDVNDDEDDDSKDCDDAFFGKAQEMVGNLLENSKHKNVPQNQSSKFTCSHCSKIVRCFSQLHQHIVECGNEKFIRDQVTLRHKKENLTKSTALPSACVSTATATIAKIDTELFRGLNTDDTGHYGARVDVAECHKSDRSMFEKPPRPLSSNSGLMTVVDVEHGGESKNLLKRRYNTRKAVNARPVRSSRKLSV